MTRWSDGHGRLGSLVLGLVLVAALVPSAQGEGPPGRAGAVALDWARPVVEPVDDVALGPGQGSTTLATESVHRRARLVLTRWSASGDRLWTRRWDGGSGRVLEVHAERVAVSGSTGAVFVAGNAMCRYGASESGPLFVRMYRPDGALVWHRWAARCPADPGGVIRATSQVTGLDVRGGRLAVSGSFGNFCCEDDFRDAFVRLYTTEGALRWEKDVELARFPGTNESALDVALGPRTVYVVGAVETEPRVSPPAPVDLEAFVTGLRRSDGTVVWRRVVTDEGAPDYDAYTTVSANGRVLAVGGVLDATQSSDDLGTAVVERWRPAGSRVWRRPLPDLTWLTRVRSLPRGAVIAGGTVGVEVRTDILIRRYRADGSRAWSWRWDRGDAALALTAFDATGSVGVGGGRVSPAPVSGLSGGTGGGPGSRGSARRTS